VQQNLSSSVDLTTASQLLANSTFSNFVSPPSGVTPTTPQLYYRIGARHDEDVPGPVNWISNSPRDSDRVYRYVYSPIVPFTPAPLPPSQPGSSSKAAKTLNARNGTRAGVLAPVMPRSVGRANTPGGQPLSLQQILTGRSRH
jgi:hypothetical protein